MEHQKQKFPALQKLYFLPFKTQSFFQKIDHEKDYFSILLFLVITNLTASVILFFLRLPSFLGQKDIIIREIFGIILGIILSFSIPFVSAILIHLGVLIFRGKQGFFNTFKPVTYTLTLMVLYIFLLNIILLFYNLVIPVDPESFKNFLVKIQSGNATVADLSPFKAVLGIISLILIGTMIHSLYATTLGISKFQNIKKWKAFIAIILVPLVLIFLYVFLVSFLYLSP